ncbi:MAG TPA: hypothetical protein VJL87_02510 [Bdellovibrionota bacterium]|nr:hypothetical protein [Bdellovibrionota bacterium]
MPPKIFDPRGKLLSLTSKLPALFVVAYVGKAQEGNIFAEAEQDVEASLEGGADGVIFINEYSTYQDLEFVLQKMRPKYPNSVFGCNYLGDPNDLYGYKGTFRLVKEYNLQIAWTDFSGVDLIQERPSISLHDIEMERPEDVFYCSGVHMKYSTLLDPSKPLLKSAFQAMGWVDGILLTGPKTGILADPQNVREARNATYPYPLGLASGVSPENAHLIRDHVDFVLAATSLWEAPQRISAKRIRELAKALLTKDFPLSS